MNIIKLLENSTQTHTFVVSSCGAFTTHVRCTSTASTRHVRTCRHRQHDKPILLNHYKIRSVIFSDLPQGRSVKSSYFIPSLFLLSTTTRDTHQFFSQSSISTSIWWKTSLSTMNTHNTPARGRGAKKLDTAAICR